LILYLDTSALVKLYVEERGRRAVMRAVRRARRVTTTIVAYVELRAAIARMARRGLIDAAGAEAVRGEFEREWAQIRHLEPDRALIRRAGDLAESLGLRGYDALHLASAERLRTHGSGIRVVFACFDESLNSAARLLGLEIVAGG
jgi:predicted nucleic acid-binding protein